MRGHCRLGFVLMLAGLAAGCATQYERQGLERDNRELRRLVGETRAELDEVQRRETRGEVHEQWVDNPAYLSLKQLLGETELELKGIQARIFH